MKVHVIPALDDNYNFIIQGNSEVAVIDPSQAEPILKELKKYNLKLNYIFITHHHYDHVDGIELLKKKTNCQVFASAHDIKRIKYVDNSLEDGDIIQFDGSEIKVIACPGHTLGHIAYHIPSKNLLFCGDTLFSLGCGRLFEGTPEQMHNSLNKFKSLANDTMIYCAHEYTLANGKFALSVNPDNQDLQEYISKCRTLREKKLPTIPTNLDTEKKCNPFLRLNDPNIIKQLNITVKNEIAVLAKLRELKNNFR